ncbi:amidase [Sarocladium strictum]
MAWEEIAKKKRDARHDAIQAAAKYSDIRKDCVQLENKSVTNITTGISSGELTAESITRSAISNAAKAHLDSNCLSEPLFDEALDQARYLDNYFRETGKLLGPLHGVPISVKDQFNVKGVDTTLGYVGRSFKPAQEDAVLVRILKTLGAVVITKTSIPQSILWGETESPLWGVTTYPGRLELTPGGSSGGEAALLAMSGSLIGWGTDIGGSIRGPAHICGLFGLKPTSTRFPYAGVPVSHEGQSHVPSSIGPLACDLETIVVATREFINAESWVLDPNVTPLAWREDMYQLIQKRRLRIGVILDDGVVKPHPDIEVAVRQAAILLERAGHELIRWDTSDHLSCINIMDQFYRADGGEDIRLAVSEAGEPMIPHVQALVDSSKPISVYEYWQLNRQRTAAQLAYNKKWNDTANAEGRCVDVIISPVLPHTAVPHRSACWTGYSKIWNFLDYAALAVPFSSVGDSRNVDKNYELSLGIEEARRRFKEHQPRNAMDKQNQQTYDSVLLDGLPVGVQIIGRRFEEEKVLGVAKVLDGLWPV